jgi:hypothetical protein
MQSGEPTTITLGTGHELLFNPDDIYLDSNRDAHIRKSGSFHRIANDSYDSHCYANQAKEILNATYGNRAAYTIKKVIFNPPATVAYWSDCTKTVVKCNVNDIFDPEKGLAMAIAKRCAGNTSAYYAEIRHWVAECGKDYPGKPYTESSSIENNCHGKPYMESSSIEKDALKKYIAQAKKSYETALEAATKGNPVNFLSEMGRVSAALSMLELEINK